MCVKGKGKEESHRRQKRGDESCKPHLCFDYKTFGQEGDYDDKATVLVCKDEITKMKFAHICERKSATEKVGYRGKSSKTSTDWDTLKWF